MATESKGKRSASTATGSSKKRKLNNGAHKKTGRSQKDGQPKKQKAADRGIIPIPSAPDDDHGALSDQDIDLLDEFGHGAEFLTKLDPNGLMKSKKELLRLHELTKPMRKSQAKDDDLPSLNSDSDGEAEDDWDSNIEDTSEGSADSFPVSDVDSDMEMPYESAPRKWQSSRDISTNPEIRRLPIKLADGQFKDTGVRLMSPTELSEQDSDNETEPEQEDSSTLIEDVSTGARFGRPAVADVLQTSSRKQKIELAKEQIALICQEILADPENSLGLLRRLHTFSLATITTPTHPDGIPNDPVIRQLAILSQLAIFKDIVPGYRVRPLTDAEKSEKVSQMVARTRDWEQGLVSVYQTYLKSLEREWKGRTQLSSTSLHAICVLLRDLTHFNFRVNLMSCIVSHLSKKSWDASSEECSKTLISVFREDSTGLASLEIVRLMNRMVKERHFKVHPNVLGCLLHLRLRSELDVRASDRFADKIGNKKGKAAKGKKAGPVHLSKKAKKALKEQKEINKELREAEAEVDKEERKTTQTETLKLLFALYFRILKNPTPTPLLPSALSGVSRFAHLVNIDFFKDLMKVLKNVINLEESASFQGLESTGEEADLPIAGPNASIESITRRLRCIVTAFELLKGQGEAFNIDLSEFVSSLYALLMNLTFFLDLESHRPSSISGGRSFNGPDRPNATMGTTTTPSVIDLVFRAVDLIFSPRTSGGSAVAGSGVPPWRSAAFCKRLLSLSLHWPSPAVLRTLEFVKSLVSTNPKLEAMLSTEDRIFNGVYRPEVDDPQLSHPFETSFWELHTLSNYYWDAKVREEAKALLRFKSQ